MQDICKDKIIIYGAGYCGAMFAELLRKAEIYPICFFDQNPAKAGRRIMDIPVKLPCRGEAGDLIIVCILKKGELYKEIEKNMKQLGYQNVIHIYDLREEAGLFQGQNVIIVPDREQVLANRERYSNLEKHLADELSRQVLAGVMEFMLIGADAKIPTEKLEEQYFAYDIYRKIENENVVDCGAFKGDVMRIFLEKNQNKFQHYIAIEADKSYLPFLQATAMEYGSGKIEVLNCAVSNKKENLRLRNYVQEDSVIKEDGETEIKAFSLDELLVGRKCTFLKIDVEGYDRGCTEAYKRAEAGSCSCCLSP